MLFPDGRTKHSPADGGSISREDVRKARQNSSLAAQMAAYFERRSKPKTESEIMFAEAGVTAPAPVLKAAPAPVARPAPEIRVAALERDMPTPEPSIAPPAPKLVQAPRPAAPLPNDAERRHLNQLVTLASLDPSEALIRPQPPRSTEADRRRLDQMVSTAAIGAPAPTTAAAPVAPPAPSIAALVDKIAAPPRVSEETWAPNPEFDDDHPEELSYRPFPIAPLLTQSASADDAALVKLVHPDLQRTLELLDDKEIVLPMRLRPGGQVSEVTWAQQFQGSAVDFSAQHSDDTRTTASQQLTSRSVRTTAR